MAILPSHYKLTEPSSQSQGKLTFVQAHSSCYYCQHRRSISEKANDLSVWQHEETIYEKAVFNPMPKNLGFSKNTTLCLPLVTTNAAHVFSLLLTYFLVFVLNLHWVLIRFLHNWFKIYNIAADQKYHGETGKEIFQLL